MAPIAQLFDARPVRSRRALVHLAAAVCFWAPLAAAAADRIVYVSPGGNDARDGGSPATAVSTLARAFVLAGAGPAELRIAAGRYVEPVRATPAALTLSGGWDPSFAPARRRLLTADDLLAATPASVRCEVHTCLTSTTSDAAVVLAAGTAAPQPVTLSQLVVIGPDRGGVAGASSYGIVVDRVPVRLDGVLVVGGNGGPGASGGPGTAGRGLCARGGGGGMVDVRDKTVTISCWGQPGQRGDSPVAGVDGGSGGKEAYGECAWPKAKKDDPPVGSVGGTGGHGLQGAPGMPVLASSGGFRRVGNELAWLAPAAPPGSAGSAGGGGGGGGAGGSWDYFCWFVGYAAIGGTGGGGGSGGCGGGGGQGGGSGGASLGLVIHDANVVARDVAVLGGRGGVGGAGGAGAAGSPGSGGGNGLEGSRTDSNSCKAHTGGRGGAGGTGGAGGGGSGGVGGAGGPAYGIARVGDHASFVAQGVERVDAGQAGAGGAGGPGADDGTPNAQGAAGTSAPTEVFVGVAAP